MESQWTAAGKGMQRGKQTRHALAVFHIQPTDFVSVKSRGTLQALLHTRDGAIMMYSEGGQRRIDSIRFRDMAEYPS